jgi:hypothetical protein
VSPWVKAAQAAPVSELLTGGTGSPLHAFSASLGAPTPSGSSDATAAQVRAGAAAMAARVMAAEAAIEALGLDKAGAGH